MKADALSRLHAPEEDCKDPESILLEDLFLCPIHWSSESIPPSSVSTNDPLSCLPGLQYVTRTQRTPLIHSAHASLGTGHPEANGTLSLLKDCFWWPNMARDVRRFVQGCPDCAISKSPRHLPSGKLLPLPVPNRPWSHLGVDFITDLPPSDGNTCILVIVDRFFKSCRLLPLKDLPMAIETAEIIQPSVQVFRDPRRHRVRPRTPIHFPRLEGILLPPRCDRKTLIGLSSADERADREEDPGDRTIPTNILPRPRELLEPVSGLGRVCTKLPTPTIYWAHSFPVCARLPASSLPLVRRTIRGAIGRLLVPRE